MFQLLIVLWLPSSGWRCDVQYCCSVRTVGGKRSWVTARNCRYVDSRYSRCGVGGCWPAPALLILRLGPDTPPPSPQPITCVAIVTIDGVRIASNTAHQSSSSQDTRARPHLCQSTERSVLRARCAALALAGARWRQMCRGAAPGARQRRGTERGAHTRPAAQLRLAWRGPRVPALLLWSSLSSLRSVHEVRRQCNNRVMLQTQPQKQETRKKKQDKIKRFSKKFHLI